MIKVIKTFGTLIPSPFLRSFLIGNLLKMWLMATEKRYGGFVKGIKRRKVSLRDPRTRKVLRSSTMQGGDRMTFHGYAKKYAEYLEPFLYEKNKGVIVTEICQAGALLADPNDPNDFAVKIRQVIKDTGLRNKIIESAKVIVRNFSWEKTARETLKVYENF